MRLSIMCHLSDMTDYALLTCVVGSGAPMLGHVVDVVIIKRIELDI